MKKYLISPKSMFYTFWGNRALIFLLARREVLGRYSGSILGVFWSFINPLLMLAVYTFFFSIVFKAEWATGRDSRSEFALILFSGLMVFNIFSECLLRAPTLILSNVNLVKKVVFPLEILSWVNLMTAFFHFFISLNVWCVVYFVFFRTFHLTVFMMPLILLPLAFFTIGFSWFFASLGVYIRDLPQLMGTLISILMFLSPIFYPATKVPDSYRFYLNFNPLTPAIEMSRDLMFFGKVPDFFSFFYFLIIGLLIAFLGFTFFQKTRRGFSDVL